MIMRFPGGLPKALTLSYDDGVEQDEQLIAIAEKYGLKGTFSRRMSPMRRERFTAACP